MYSYYLLTLLEVDLKWFKKFITSLQLLQLVAANVLSLYLWYPPNETWPNYAIILLFNAYVFVLVLLFSKFFRKEYISSHDASSKKGEKGDGSSTKNGSDDQIVKAAATTATTTKKAKRSSSSLAALATEASTSAS